MPCNSIFPYLRHVKVHPSPPAKTVLGDFSQMRGFPPPLARALYYLEVGLLVCCTSEVTKFPLILICDTCDDVFACYYRSMMCRGSKGLLTKVVDVMKKEPTASTFRSETLPHAQNMQFMEIVGKGDHC